MMYFYILVKHFSNLSYNVCQGLLTSFGASGGGGAHPFVSVGGPSRISHHVVQNGVLGFYLFVFVLQAPFLIFGLLSYLVQKTRLTSSLHFFK